MSRIISIKGCLDFPKTTQPLLFVGPMSEQESSEWLTKNGFVLCGQHWLNYELASCKKDGVNLFPRQNGLVADVEIIPSSDDIIFVKKQT